MALRRIAFIGLGAMGSGMAARLASSGFEVAVWNRTASKTEPLAELGARIAGTPADAARDAELVLVSVADAGAVTEVLFGTEGVVRTLAAGSLVADLSTVPPEFARELAEQLGAAGHRFLDARVLGNAEHARDGELRVMVGGDAADLETARPAFEAIGKEVLHLGGHGAGATMKLALNLLMGVEMQAMAEAIVFGERAGLDRAAVIRAIAASGYASPVMRFKAGPMARRDYDRADFRLRLMLKDLSLVLDQASSLGVPMPATDASRTALESAMSLGLADLDCSAILTHAEHAASAAV